MKNILVINAHTNENSFCFALSNNYIKGAKKSGNKIKTLNLKDLDLEKFVKHIHDSKTQLPEDLQEVQKNITWSDHLVFVYPTWWATPPALLKVFFEMVFSSGFAFNYKSPSNFGPRWDKLLINKTARIISTMDSPPLFYKLVIGDPGYKMMKDILNFCGIKPVKKNYFGSVKVSDSLTRKTWLEKINKVGLNE